MKTATQNVRSLAAIGLALIAAAALTLLASGAHAQVSKDLESLGSNRDVNKRAARLESRSRVAIVQNRTVKRNWRPEIGIQYAPVAYGDSYLQTQNVGLNADLHFTPKFSVGVRYSKAYNNLTNEGKAQYDRAQDADNSGSTDYSIPDVDVPQETILGVVNWYMMYGKINFFDASVIQFDIYSLAGGGQVQLKSGPTSTWTAGGGIGFWLNQHMTSRLRLKTWRSLKKIA